MQRQIRPLLFPRSLIWIVCCAIIAISTCRARATESPSDSSPSSLGFSEQRFENEVKKYLGIPYRKGGASKQGMDCSGFARTVYDRLLGIDLPHNSIDQFRFSELEKIDSGELQTGDLIFFANKKKKRINHVGVYLSDGQFIHASSSQGITVSSLDDKYWKRRFVGSKRHMALGANQEIDDLRFESYLEVPVGQDGALIAHSRDEFRTSSLARPNDPSTSDLEISADPLGLNFTPLNLYEIGYGQTLFDGFEVSLSGIYEKFDAYSAWSGLDFASQYMDYNRHDSNADTSVRQGLKLASDFRPSSWMSITPSVTFFDYSRENTVLAGNSPKRTLGLNTLLAPMDSRWSLTMLLQYSDRESPTEMSNFDNMFGSMDMAIKLGVTLTDNLRFSIMGKHDTRTAAYAVEDSSSLQAAGGHNVFLSFDLSY